MRSEFTMKNENKQIKICQLLIAFFLLMTFCCFEKSYSKPELNGYVKNDHTTDAGIYQSEKVHEKVATQVQPLEKKYYNSFPHINYNRRNVRIIFRIGDMNMILTMTFKKMFKLDLSFSHH